MLQVSGSTSMFKSRTPLVRTPTSEKGAPSGLSISLFLGVPEPLLCAAIPELQTRQASPRPLPDENVDIVRWNPVNHHTDRQPPSALQRSRQKHIHLIQSFVDTLRTCILDRG